jgi:hypothetical protein
MRFIIEARVVDDESSDEPILLGEIERPDLELDPATLGLTLAEGRCLLRDAQQALVTQQVARWLQRQSMCDCCGSPYAHKDQRTVTYRSIFGRLALLSPRWFECSHKCERVGSRSTFSPLTIALPERVSPQLEQLQVKFAAHLPYARAVEVLQELLPLDECISVSATKNRVRAMADHLEAMVATGIEKLPRAQEPAAPSAKVKSIAVDSVWLRHCAPMRTHARQVSIAAARATLADGTTRLCGYVTKQVQRSSKRLDLFVSQLGVRPHERVTAVADAAGEFETALGESQYVSLRIVDWFHIAMKFRAAQLSASGIREQLPDHWKGISMRLERAKWRLWHGRAKSAVEAISTIAPVIEALGVECASTLLRNVDKLQTYLESNERYLIDYGKRYRAGLPISSAPAESAVNQLVSLRMAKQQQMRWSDEGAHALVQVRAAVLNGQLLARVRTVPWYRRPAKNSCQFEDFEALAA